MHLMVQILNLSRCDTPSFPGIQRMIQGALTQAPPFSKAVTLKHGEKVKDLLASNPKCDI